MDLSAGFAALNAYEIVGKPKLKGSATAFDSAVLLELLAKP